MQFHDLHSRLLRAAFASLAVVSLLNSPTLCNLEEEPLGNCTAVLHSPPTASLWPPPAGTESGYGRWNMPDSSDSLKPTDSR